MSPDSGNPDGTRPPAEEIERFERNQMNCAFPRQKNGANRNQWMEING